MSLTLGDDERNVLESFSVKIVSTNELNGIRKYAHDMRVIPKIHD